ncbi:DUF5818 domain-containing protein [Sphingobium sp. CR2-8]|uniref:DUF5818 domain-containing protein n=1 Tax=Sphingobium sp. CR2-8 TaxID=1306534 RepID=UPI002DBF25DE|nr:DUF5818 domain-containing protein [Sphingobium sp. CR2-8]MEC3910323.1 DUF5818 domain-containing protein [Sphingobium sp. CR2-8]
MPLGAAHEEVGILIGDGVYPVLKIEGGGKWRLDPSCRYRHLIGQRVRVYGTRADFDLLDVKRIEPA